MRRWIAPLAGALMVLVGVCGIASVALFATSPVGAPDTRRDDASRIDQIFIEQMVPHHEDAIAMADLALERAEHPELRELARGIKKTQTDENEQMRAWYEEWFDEDVPEDGRSDMMDWMMGGTADLEELEDADPFDKAFIEQMIPHHQMAVMMARMMAARSGKEEMRELADSIIDTQTSEIEQMQEWYDEWYGQ